MAALLATKESNFLNSEMENPLKGAILIDPARLDMHWFLQETKGTDEGTKYLGAFTEDPEVWKAASPIYFLEGKNMPMLIMEGENTYPGIRLTIDRFRKEAGEKGIPIDYGYYKKKKHIPMIPSSSGLITGDTRKFLVLWRRISKIIRNGIFRLKFQIKKFG